MGLLDFLKGFFSGASGLQPAGPPQQLATFDSRNTLISKQAEWHDGAIVIQAEEPGTVRLLEYPLDVSEDCRLDLKFEMGSSDLVKSAFPEIWVRVDGMGEFFSKGHNFRLLGTNDWTSCELPFYLKQNQPANLIKFNMVFEGGGSVLVKHIRLYSTPLK